MTALPLLLIAHALAADEEMIVEDTLTAEEAQALVAETLAGLEYRAVRQRGAWTVYRGGRLSPTLLVSEGIATTRGRHRRTASNTVSGNYRRQLGARGRVFEALDPALDQWQQALQREHMDARYFTLPDRLAATWSEGAPLDGRPAGATPAERRAVLLSFWASRTHTPEGDRVRQITADFIEYVVQDSPWPVSETEQAAAEAACRCGPLLPVSPSAPR